MVVTGDNDGSCWLWSMMLRKQSPTIFVDSRDGFYGASRVVLPAVTWFIISPSNFHVQLKGQPSRLVVVVRWRLLWLSIVIPRVPILEKLMGC